MGCEYLNLDQVLCVNRALLLLNHFAVCKLYLPMCIIANRIHYMMKINQALTILLFCMLTKIQEGLGMR